jgi:hypothetical protein
VPIKKKTQSKINRRNNKNINNLPLLGTISRGIRKVTGMPSFEEETKEWKAYKAENKANKEAKTLEKASKIQAKHAKAREERAKAREKD